MIINSKIFKFMKILLCLFLVIYSSPVLASGPWEILPFENIEINDSVTIEYIGKLEQISSLLMTPGTYHETSKVNFPLTDTDFRRWVESNLSVIDTSALYSPYGIPIEYVFTDGHHSYMLNYYDNNGSLWLSYLGGASHRVGAIPYKSLKNQGEKLGIALDNFIWNKDSWRNAVGNLISDAMREETKSDVAIANFLGMRSNISKGVITTEHIKRVLPFNNEIAIVKISGKELIQILEDSVIKYKTPYAVSGIYKDRTGKYFLQNSTAFDTSLLYTLALSSYLAKGGRYGDYAFFTKKEKIGFKKITIREAVANYIKKHSPIKPDYGLRFGERISPDKLAKPTSIRTSTGSLRFEGKK